MSSEALAIAWICIVAYSTIQGYLLFFIFPTYEKGSKQARWLLALISLLCAVSLTEELLERTVGYDTLPHLIFTLDSLWYVFGPIIFFYIRLHCKNHGVSRYDLWHAIPFVWVIISTMDFYMLPGVYKLNYLELLANGYTHPIHNLNFILFCVQSVFYVISSWILLNQSKKIYGNYSEWRWMIQLIVSLGFITLMSLLTIFSLNWGMDIIPWSEDLYALWVSGLLLILFLKSIRSPRELYFLRTPSSAQKMFPDAKASSAFDELLHLINEQKPYRDPELDINSLAKQLGYSKNHLNNIIKANTGMSFREFMNQYRIKEAKTKLNSPLSRQFTIESIAYDAGFSSLATFYRVFKRVEGTTPKTFIQQ